MHHDGSLHFCEIINQLISSIAPFSSLIPTITACVLAIIRLYLLDLVIIPKALTLAAAA
jgi:hypothetical protein